MSLGQESTEFLEAAPYGEGGTALPPSPLRIEGSLAFAQLGSETTPRPHGGGFDMHDKEAPTLNENRDRDGLQPAVTFESLRLIQAKGAAKTVGLAQLCRVISTTVRPEESDSMLHRVS